MKKCVLHQVLKSFIIATAQSSAHSCDEGLVPFAMEQKGLLSLSLQRGGITLGKAHWQIRYFLKIMPIHSTFLPYAARS